MRVQDSPPLDVAPGTGFFVDGRRQPTFVFSADSAGPIAVDVVRQSDGVVVATLEADAQTGDNTLRWNGVVGGRAAAPGAYAFRLATASPSALAAEGATEAFTLVDPLFPIRGRHNLGHTRTNRFGGGRDHQGIDMFARCGTRLAAARGGRVVYAGYHGSAGNYVVIDGAGTGVHSTYMHMREAPLVRTGQRVFTGQQLSDVGDTGNANGCHLHFEMWSAPGWYKGGSPFDPLPELKRWDSYS